MKSVKVKFVGFGDVGNVRKSLVFSLLERHFAVELSETPDYVFFCSGGEHFRYNDCIKIVIQGENQTVDFNAYDYGVGFDYMTFGDRYLRSPLFARCLSFQKLETSRREAALNRDRLLNRKFCSFVVSHQSAGDPMREKFFKRLSQYKRVDSGGRFLNNVGGAVKDKLEFCRNYKFNIAFENSSSLGYTTEKIVDAYVALSVPIYYGNPAIETDFNLESMVRVTGEEDIERSVEEIIGLDNDDCAYMEKLTAPCLAVPDAGGYACQLESFLAHIFEQPLERARRRNIYGCQAVAERRTALMLKTYYAITNSWAYSAARNMYGTVLRVRRRE